MSEKQKISKLSIAALVFGIIGIFLNVAPVIAIILAETFRYNNKKREVPLGGKALAWWGFGLGVASLCVNITFILLKK